MKEKNIELYYTLSNEFIISIMEEITNKYRKHYYETLNKRANKINKICVSIFKYITPLIILLYSYNKIASIESFITLLLGFCIYYIVYYAIIKRLILCYISIIKKQKSLPEFHIKKKFKTINNKIKMFEGDYSLKFDGNIISLNKHDHGETNIELEKVNTVFVNENLIILNDKILILTHSDFMNKDEYAKGVEIIMDAVKKNNPKFTYDD